VEKRPFAAVQHRHGSFRAALYMKPLDRKKKTPRREALLDAIAALSSGARWPAAKLVSRPGALAGPGYSGMRYYRQFGAAGLEQGADARIPVPASCGRRRGASVPGARLKGAGPVLLLVAAGAAFALSSFWCLVSFGSDPGHKGRRSFHEGGADDQHGPHQDRTVFYGA